MDFRWAFGTTDQRSLVNLDRGQEIGDDETLELAMERLLISAIRKISWLAISVGKTQSPRIKTPSHNNCNMQCDLGRWIWNWSTATIKSEIGRLAILITRGDQRSPVPTCDITQTQSIYKSNFIKFEIRTFGLFKCFSMFYKFLYYCVKTIKGYFLRLLHSSIFLYKWLLFLSNILLILK